MNLNQIEECAITIANGIFGSIETKERVKDMIMNLIASSCIQYSIDKKFKKEIDCYLALRKTR
ncbi:hypothetical protein EDM57_04280 [Brevibacillus gelatini]|uniref:Uncharacterized protein n=1 Tax=Brevibacillus gelatini TaxID=1655277 RepID=A0A3M8B7F4_9BACL|nr:hypothetical protein EDM57_04280 [Brevibacillus gelatini]